MFYENCCGNILVERMRNVYFECQECKYRAGTVCRLTEKYAEPNHAFAASHCEMLRNSNAQSRAKTRSDKNVS